MKLKKLLGDDHLTCSIADADKNLQIKELEFLLYDARGLIDAVYELIEIADVNAEWKRKWLEAARKHGASGL